MEYKGFFQGSETLRYDIATEEKYPYTFVKIHRRYTQRMNHNEIHELQLVTIYKYFLISYHKCDILI